MERAMFHSPKKNAFIPGTNNCTSPTTCSTPITKNDKKQWQNGHTTNGLNGFSLLPNHITPPSGLTKFIARNPFDADLTSRLHLSVISPTVFTKVSATAHIDSPGFSWSVDELANIQPAKIDEYPVQQMHCTDPDVEEVAQAAINKFFSDNQIIPSPWDSDKKKTNVKSSLTTPCRPVEDFNSARDAYKAKREYEQKNCWSQTVLTLPPVLPEHIEEALKPYFTFNQDQNVESEDANSSNGSLRRKLFFNDDDSTTEDDDDEAAGETSLTPSSKKPSSPPQSGMLAHGTPIKRHSFSLQRTHGTPCAGDISPPDMSPICNIDMSCQSIRSRCQFAARLDFTADMSIDRSTNKDDRELKRLEDIEHDTNASMIRSNIIDDCPYIINDDNDETSSNDLEINNVTAEMLSQEMTPKISIDRPIKSLALTSNDNESCDDKRTTREWWKIISSNEAVGGVTSCNQQNITRLGNSCLGQQRSDANFGQDTGYQTNSMSSITANVTDNFNITDNAKFQYANEIMLTNTDKEIHLSDWQNNLKNMFSSTPSKCSTWLGEL